LWQQIDGKNPVLKGCKFYNPSLDDKIVMRNKCLHAHIACMMTFIALMATLRNELVRKNNLYLLMRVATVLIAAQIAACGSGGGSDSTASTTTAAEPGTTTTGTGTNTAAGPSAAAGPTCSGVGQVQPMAADPDTGAVDVSEYCLSVINGYRAQKGLQPYYLHSKTTEAVCCQAAEAKTAAEIGGHTNGGCGWQSQGLCAGGRNPDGTVKGSVEWCPKLFFAEGPAAPGSANHYTAMMEEKPRGIMCSFYGVSRDKHSVVVNYY
jgi:hypothetical protein